MGLGLGFRGFREGISRGFQGFLEKQLAPKPREGEVDVLHTCHGPSHRLLAWGPKNYDAEGCAYRTKCRAGFGAAGNVNSGSADLGVGAWAQARGCRPEASQTLSKTRPKKP